MTTRELEDVDNVAQQAVIERLRAGPATFLELRTAIQQRVGDACSLPVVRRLVSRATTAVGAVVRQAPIVNSLYKASLYELPGGRARSTTPSPAVTAPPAPAPRVEHSNDVLRKRITAVFTHDAVDGRERLATHLVMNTNHDAATILLCLRAAGAEFTVETRALRARMRLVLSDSESHGREAVALALLMVQPALDGPDIFRALRRASRY